MRFLAYGPICLAAGATAVGPLTDVPPEVIRGGELAVLGWVVYYVLVKIFPAQVKAQKEQRDAFLKLLRDLGVIGKNKNE